MWYSPTAPENPRRYSQSLRGVHNLETKINFSFWLAPQFARCATFASYPYSPASTRNFGSNNGRPIESPHAIPVSERWWRGKQIMTNLRFIICFVPHTHTWGAHFVAGGDDEESHMKEGRVIFAIS